MHRQFSNLNRRLVLGLGTLSFATAALGHHSFAMFDAKQTVTAHATVKELQWTNPHSWLELVANGEDGTERSLSLELTGVSGLRQAGWKPATLKPGDKVLVVYHPMRDGTPAGQLVMIVTADGRKLKGR